MCSWHRTSHGRCQCSRVGLARQPRTPRAIRRAGPVWWRGGLVRRMTKPLIATILPPREGFSTGSAGAIGLLVQRLAAFPASFDTPVIGAAPPDSFPGIAYRAAPMPWLRLHPLRRYEAGVARVLRAAQPSLIEVHN